MGETGTRSTRTRQLVVRFKAKSMERERSWKGTEAKFNLLDYDYK